MIKLCDFVCIGFFLQCCKVDVENIYTIGYTDHFSCMLKKGRSSDNNELGSMVRLA
jgi:hypothetical protein